MTPDIKERPCIVGTGLLALDVVYKDGSADPVQVSVGGTCGNVLIILGYLGWQAVPVARLDHDPARALLETELDRWNIDTRFLSMPPAAATPIIIERLREATDGQARHSFSWNCPCCGEWLPRYKPVTVRSLRSALELLPNADIFFFDRPSPGALALAKHFVERGALVVFEPSAKGNPRAFEQALEQAHIVKYADERMARLPVPMGKLPQLLLEIQTLGKSGLRYRGRIAALKGRGWQRIHALRAPRLLDTVGCGDWCTAGLVARMGSAGTAGLQSMDPDALHAALQYGQALAAWNCGFVGARGGMYRRTSAEMASDINRILKNRTIALSKHAIDSATTRAMSAICPACNTNGQLTARESRS